MSISFLKNKKIVNGIKNSFIVKCISDKLFLKIAFRLKMGYKLDLKKPQTFNEKLQWLKLNDRNPEYNDLVDKYNVRDVIKNKIGEKYLIPIYGVWEKFDDIDFSKLPNQFVLKCNHDSGGLVICKDKSKLDIESAKKKINNCLKTNYFYHSREWAYKDVKPLIIAEKYMEDDSGDLIDYKFYCFNGYVDCVMVCLGRQKGNTKFYFFDKDWKLLRINKSGKEAEKDFTLQKPVCIDKMFEIASELSKGLKFARVDLYECKNEIYFGEITLIPDSGLDKNLTKEADIRWASKIEI